MSLHSFLYIFVLFLDLVQIKSEQCIILKTKDGNKVVMTNSDEIGLKEWSTSLQSAYKNSNELFSGLAKKAGKIYGADGIATTNTTTASTGNNVSSTISSSAAASAAGAPGGGSTIPQPVSSLTSNATNNSQ